MARLGIDPKLIGQRNESAFGVLKGEYDALGETLAGRGVEIDRIKEKAAKFEVAVPSWGVGTGGTRFARFPGTGEPRTFRGTATTIRPSWWSMPRREASALMP